MATNNYFNIYLSDTFALAETLVIKSEQTARGLNSLIAYEFGDNAVDLGRPDTWKYYLNVSGLYHPTDKMMRVVSLDTLEEIDFTKENLRLHRATNNAYQYGSRYYLELLSRFPGQEMLIKGILYPADLDKAIKAKDGSILSYKPDLVEYNEYSFVKELQDWIYLYRKQFRNPQYNTTHELFEAVCLAQLYMHLVPAIMNIRLRKCRTNEAHSYHVRRYLASHGFLDEYLNYLTTRQALWCYRNINYIERYAGHADTFEWLIENLMTDRSIPIGEYRMYHDTTYQPNGVEPFRPELYTEGKAIYPRVLFTKRKLNNIAHVDGKDTHSLIEMFDKEDPLAVDNPRFKEDDATKAKTLMKHSLSNKLLTKMLESSMYDYTDSLYYKQADIMVNQWIQRAFEGTYKAAITAVHPQTGDSIPLTAKEALYLLYYAFRKALGQEVKYLPTFKASRVPRHPIPDTTDIRKHVPWDRISEESARLALELMPVTGVAISIEQFYNDCVKYWEAANLQRNLISVYDHLEDRAYAENMVNRIYCIAQFPPEREDYLYSKWLSEHSISLHGLHEDDYWRLFETLLIAGTGVELSNVMSSRNVQKAMVNLLLQLSSYSIQVVRDINDGNIHQGDGLRIRVGDREADTVSEIDAGIELGVEVFDYTGSVEQWVDFDTNKVDAEDEVDGTVEAETLLVLPNLFNDPAIRERSDGHHEVYHVDIARMDYGYNYGRYPNRLGLSPLWLNDFDYNSPEFKHYDLVDIYQRDYGCSIEHEESVDINQYFSNPNLPGFDPKP